MNITLDTLDRAADRAEAFSKVFLDKVFIAAQPGAVFGAPVVSGEYTVITASEVGAGGGFGSGRGTGTSVAARSTENGAPVRGEGRGIGGGGGASGRPIAAIVIGPDGVTVKPIVDLTRIALAGITAWGAMLAIYFKLRAKSR
jgi:uncharacterized spore protein YtfJ